MRLRSRSNFDGYVILVQPHTLADVTTPASRGIQRPGELRLNLLGSLCSAFRAIAREPLDPSDAGAYRATSYIDSGRGQYRMKPRTPHLRPLAIAPVHPGCEAVAEPLADPR